MRAHVALEVGRVGLPSSSTKCVHPYETFTSLLGRGGGLVSIAETPVKGQGGKGLTPHSLPGTLQPGRRTFPVPIVLVGAS